jgi:hypothetical protein
LRRRDSVATRGTIGRTERPGVEGVSPKNTLLAPLSRRCELACFKTSGRPSESANSALECSSSKSGSLIGFNTTFSARDQPRKTIGEPGEPGNPYRGSLRGSAELR